MRMLLAGAVIAAATAPTVQLGPLQTLLEVLAGAAGLGGLLVAAVAIYKARAERDLNTSQAMALLFEKQREVNKDLLAQRDGEIANLQAQIAHADGDRKQLEQRLRECQRDRTVLRSQLRGLERTLAELHRLRRHDDDRDTPLPYDGPGD